jgi:DUF971 family protein
MSDTSPILPVVVRRDGDRLRIEWSDGLVSLYPWKLLRDNCPCAVCREERQVPPDPFRILKSNELVPLAAVAMPRVGHYAYKIVWSDGHDSGIYTLEFLRELGQRPECIAPG